MDSSVFPNQHNMYLKQIAVTIKYENESMHYNKCHINTYARSRRFCLRIMPEYLCTRMQQLRYGSAYWLEKESELLVRALYSMAGMVVVSWKGKVDRNPCACTLFVLCRAMDGCVGVSTLALFIFVRSTCTGSRDLFICHHALIRGQLESQRRRVKVLLGRNPVMHRLYGCSG